MKIRWHVFLIKMIVVRILRRFNHICQINDFQSDRYDFITSAVVRSSVQMGGLAAGSAHAVFQGMMVRQQR
ncbi:MULTISPECIES: hypothetical protein [unclassified Acidovorax]|uniref:hypothetical protein n=1 Tax=unclassified Acidovorax TaxID=2684926 RepID=UPI001C44FB10|nr:MULTISPECIES: hypothetical protein [unclassified Acidovorax]MBV7458488.1 hypothetical protein [Acidovorax sp. sif0632]MBV7463690.1 hypothetical protein [Acidovorax sp. sif0613]